MFKYVDVKKNVNFDILRIEISKNFGRLKLNVKIVKPGTKTMTKNNINIIDKKVSYMVLKNRKKNCINIVIEKKNFH